MMVGAMSVTDFCDLKNNTKTEFTPKFLRESTTFLWKFFWWGNERLRFEIVKVKRQYGTVLTKDKAAHKYQKHMIHVGANNFDGFAKLVKLVCSNVGHSVL